MSNTLLYTRLGLYPNSTEQEIKKAYNKLSKIHHPDKNLNNIDIAKQKFTELIEAKNILLDPCQRKNYDLHGLSGLDDSKYSFTKFDPINDIINFDSYNENIKYIYKNIIKTIDVTLEDLYNEKIINVNYKQKIYCNICNGKGTFDKIPNKCIVCNNKHIYIKIIKVGDTIHKNMERCNICISNDSNDSNLCNICFGNCFTISNTSIDVVLKSGLTTDNKIILNNKGNKYKNKNSDLIIIIKELKHSIYSRINNDLFINIELKLYQSLFGFVKIISRLDGKKLYINSLTTTSFNDIKKINNEGMKFIDSNTYGDLYIKFNIVLPNILNILSSNNISNLKKILCYIDKSEFENEKLIKINNTLHMSIMLDCK